MSRFAVECVIECDKADGTKCKPGDIIIDGLAWMLCMPGFRNADPRFKPADEATAKKVADELIRIQPAVDNTKTYLQGKIDEYAAAGRFTIDPATGFFKRLADGTLAGKPKNIEAHICETAEGYGLKPKQVSGASNQDSDKDKAKA